MPEHFWFTFIHNPAVGFTDNLYQFNSFYKLGCAVGGSYVHNPLRNYRSARGIFEFLGFNQSWLYSMNQPEFKKKRLSRLVLGDALLAREKIQTFEGLKNYVCLRIAEIRKENSDDVVIAFELRGSRAFFMLIQEALPERPREYPVMPAYQAVRQRESKRSLWQPESLRILVHVRQGDTATIRTPWNSYIPVLPWDEKSYKELRCPQEAKIYVPTETFFDFLKQLQLHLQPNSYSTIVFSDGYRAAFSKIYSRWRQFRFSLWQWAKLIGCQFRYDQKMFNIFKKLPDTHCLIGESDPNLYDLIQSCLTADIIVIGTQQRLIPKLLSIYHDTARPKILVILTPNGIVENYTAVLGLPAAAATIIPVPIYQYQFSDIWPVLMAATTRYNLSIKENLSP